ncbi:MAG: class A beta-lactamase-related serine hydrolase [Alphaproteobacteria bacterium]|nr:class A beta-lactamase-related serine hydrolase [Alphaproteobacteria bacterium]
MPTPLKTNEIDALFSGWDAPGTPGGALAVLRGGEVVHQRCFGLASLELGVPIRPQSRFHIASITKTFVAAASALLVERGKLGLDEDVRGIVPELKVDRPVPIRHLLGMTSGLRDSWELMQLSGVGTDQARTVDDYLDIAFNQRHFSFPVGERNVYTNINFILMGLVVERRSGRPFARFLADDVLGPLGMTATRLRDDPDDVAEDLTASYLPKSGGGWRRGVFTIGLGGAGSLISSVPDLVRWQGMFRAGGIGGVPIVRHMATPGKLADGRATNYGLGLGIRKYRGLDMWSHGGGLPGFRSIFAYLPGPDFGVVLLCNRDDADPLRRFTEIADVALADEFPEASPVKLGTERMKKVSVPGVSLASLDGRYIDRESAEVMTLKVRDAAIEADKNGHALVLRPAGGNRFVESWSNVDTIAEIEAGPNKAPVIRMDFGGQRCVFDPAPVYEPSAAALDACVGRYASDELATTFEVRRETGGLVLKLGPGFQRQALVPLEPLGPDRFVGTTQLWPGWRVVHAIRMIREGGRVAAMLVSSDRMKDVRLDRVG